jgi:recombination protein RecA
MGENDKLISAILTDVNKDLAEGLNYAKLGDSDFGQISGYISSRYKAIDRIISGKVKEGGFPIGRVVELYGDPQTGKSLVITSTLAETQARGGIAVLLDTERAYQRDWMRTLGIQDDLIVSVPDTIEDAFTQIELIIDKVRGRNPDVPLTIALDSASMLVSRHEEETGFDTVDLSAAKLLKKGIRLLVRKFAEHHVLFLVSSHMYTGPGRFAPVRTTAGGKGVHFGSSVRMEMSLGKVIEDKAGNKVGQKIKAFVSKNRVAAPYGEAELELSFEKGIDPFSGLLELMVKDGKIVQKGAWLYFGEENFQKSDWKEFYMKHQEELE